MAILAKTITPTGVELNYHRIGEYLETDEKKLQRLCKITNILSIASFTAASIIIAYYVIVFFII